MVQEDFMRANPEAGRAIARLLKVGTIKPQDKAQQVV